MTTRKEAQVFFDTMTFGATFLTIFGGAPVFLPVALVSFLGSVATHFGSNVDEQTAPSLPPPSIDQRNEEILMRLCGPHAVNFYRQYRMNGLEPQKACEKAIFDAIK